MTLTRDNIMPAWTAWIVSILMSAAITAINTGIGAGFLGRWGQAWVFAWPLATLSAYLARPMAENLTGWTLRRLGQSNAETLD